MRSFLRPFKQVHFLLLLETRQTQDSGKCLSLTLERSSPVAASRVLCYHLQTNICVCIFFTKESRETKKMHQGDSKVKECPGIGLFLMVLTFFNGLFGDFLLIW